MSKWFTLSIDAMVRVARKEFSVLITPSGMNPGDKIPPPWTPGDYLYLNERYAMHSVTARSKGKSLGISRWVPTYEYSHTKDTHHLIKWKEMKDGDEHLSRLVLLVIDVTHVFKNDLPEKVLWKSNLGPSPEMFCLQLEHLVPGSDNPGLWITQFNVELRSIDTRSIPSFVKFKKFFDEGNI